MAKSCHKYIYRRPWRRIALSNFLAIAYIEIKIMTGSDEAVDAIINHDCIYVLIPYIAEMLSYAAKQCKAPMLAVRNHICYRLCVGISFTLPFHSLFTSPANISSHFIVWWPVCNRHMRHWASVSFRIHDDVIDIALDVEVSNCRKVDAPLKLF